MTFVDYLSGIPAHLEREWPKYVELALEHALIVLAAMLIAAALAVGLGLAAYRNPGLSRAVLSVTGGFLTIPSFALFGLFVPVFGLGSEPTIVALVMYALLPMVRNTIAGLRSVPPAVTESAMGMGLTRAQRLRRIELPIAWPVIVAGARVSTLMIVGIAAIAAIVNGPGLGQPIFQGLAAIGTQRGFNLAFSGTLFVVLLALLLDSVFALVSRLTTSKGLQ